MSPEDAPQISDAIMGALLHMLSTSSGKAGGVQEDALLAVSTLIEGGTHFVFVLSLKKCVFGFFKISPQKCSLNSPCYRRQCSSVVRVVSLVSRMLILRTAVLGR